MKVASFADLMNGHQSAEIVCMVKGSVVRRLSVQGDNVLIECDDKITVPLNARITYQPWFMDRGSLLFSCEKFPDNTAKICTEFDTVQYPDGSKQEVTG